MGVESQSGPEVDERVGPPRIRRRLAELMAAPLNVDRQAVANARPSQGWTMDDLRRPLQREAPGPPVDGGVFERAKALIRDYAFADPAIVHAYYEPDAPLQGRTMVLRLRALHLVTVLVGVRILDVVDERRTVEGREAYVWGWRYGTLEGHVERGEMSWEVWKWPDTGEVDFRIHAVSRRAPIANPVIAAGFRVLGPYERRTFLRSSVERMRTLTAGGGPTG